jgi:bile acid:Na+ symporter, BASS family
MPLAGAIPEWLLSATSVATVLTIMFALGLAIVPGELREIAQRPGLMLRGLFSVLVAVPAIAWAVARAFDLPPPAEIGIMLMAVSPGAPVALRRSLRAGGHRSYAPALQISVTVLAIFSMPLLIAIFDEYYGGDASIDPWQVARQVFMAQLLPLLLGMLVAHFMASQAARLEPLLRRLSGVLLAVLIVLALINIWQVVFLTGFHIGLAIAIVTVLALAVGHLLGGPDPATRTATAISTAARNPGLALLVATVNAAAPAVQATVLAYLVIAAVTMLPYLVWRRPSAPRSLIG